MSDRIEKYTRRRTRFELLQRRQEKKANLISNLRLAVFLCGLAAALTAYLTGLYILFITVALAFAVLFIWLIAMHERLLPNQKLSAFIVKINEDCVSRMKGEWTGFTDDGSEFADEEHAFSGDLDIFGKGSLFQWTSCAKTFLGRKYLARLLSENPDGIGKIRERQEAVKELAKKTAWRQRLLAEGMLLPHPEDPRLLIEWAGERDGFYLKTWVIAAVRMLPAVTAILCILAFVLSMIPWYLPVLGLLAQYTLLKAGARKNRRVFEIAEKHSNGIKAYSRMLKLFEKAGFESGRMLDVKNRMRGGGSSAYRQVERLGAVIDSISNRHSPFYLLLNILVLWDYQNIIALERWKEDSGVYLGRWLEALGEAEALCSLSLIRHDNPDWAMPELVDGMDGFEAEKLGHPLINSSRRVVNDMAIKSPVKILIVTGSNMSGKSTFLRTAGINLVLAYAGAPVCAASFRAPLLSVYTCMRIGDNLEKSISSFHAELIRIKSIVEAVAGGRRVFFLLDEIFKGTNSIDRHAGASVLIRKLAASDSLGMVSTHDLELCTLEEDDERLENCHFREYYNEEGIYFDYKLQAGASRTRNAAYLMKLAGIDVEQCKT